MPLAIAPLSSDAIIAELGFTPANGATLSAHLADTGNPHSVTKTQVGLGNVSNDAQLPLAGGTMLGNIVLAGAPSQALHPASMAYVDQAIADLIGGAPGALDTLNELAAALSDDADFAATITTSVATKLAKASNLSDLTDPAAARTNLGLAIGSNVQAFNANLSTFAAIAPSANVQTLLIAADFAAVRTSLGLVIGTDVQAHSARLTEVATIGTALQKIRVNAAGNALEYFTDAGASPGGSDTQLQYNNAGSFGGTVGLVYNAATNPLLVITQQAVAAPAFRIKSQMASGGGTSAWVFEITDSSDARRGGWYFDTASGRFRMVVPSGVPSTGKPGLEVGSTGGNGTGLASNSESGGDLYLLAAAAQVALCNGGNGDFTLNASYALAFGSSGLASTDTFLRRGGAAEIQLGKNAASPVNQLFKAHDGVGSNIAAPDLVLAGGRNTGTPVGSITGNVRLQTSNVGAAASTTNTLVDRLLIRGSRKLVATNNTALSLFEIVLGTLAGTGGVLRYMVYATDGTDVQVRSGIVRFSAVNKAGAYTSEIVITDEAASVSAGTLTATFDILTGTNKITIRITPNTSLTATTYYVKYSLSNESEQAITTL